MANIVIHVWKNLEKKPVSNFWSLAKTKRYFVVFLIIIQKGGTHILKIKIRIFRILLFLGIRKFRIRNFRILVFRIRNFRIRKFRI